MGTLLEQGTRSVFDKTGENRQCHEKQGCASSRDERIPGSSGFVDQVPGEAEGALKEMVPVPSRKAEAMRLLKRFCGEAGLSHADAARIPGISRSAIRRSQESIFSFSGFSAFRKIPVSCPECSGRALITLAKPGPYSWLCGTTDAAFLPSSILYILLEVFIAKAVSRRVRCDHAKAGYGILPT